MPLKQWLARINSCSESGFLAAAIAKSINPAHIPRMDHELRRPEYTPRQHDRTASNLNCALAATGVTLMTLCLVGSAALTTVWAIAKLFSAGETTIWVLGLLAMAPVLALAIWTAGRAWHVEQRMARGQDVDAPVFKLFHYLRGRA